MRLTLRYLEPRDLDTCALLIRDRAIYTPAELDALKELWRELLADHSLSAMVVEDELRPAGARVVGCVFCVFVTQTFAAELKTLLPPGIGRQILRRRREHRSPLLTWQQIREGNCPPGLYALALHSGWEDTTQQEPRPETRALLDKLWETLPVIARGYCFQEMIAEQFGPWQLKTALAAGFSLATDYAGFYQKSSRLPRITLSHATPASCRVGSALSPLFTHTPSRFGFHAGEQALLREALLGGDDDLIARRLCVSLATLRKRWREMYERVSRIDPDFFCPPDDTAPPDESIGVRGVEKRRWLLGYLRHHPEELRPSPLSRH